MTQQRKTGNSKAGHRAALIATLCLFALCVWAAGPARKQQRPADERVYLIHSDELEYDHFGPNPEAQVARGHVQFRHKGATLWCDSAYFYQEANSVRAFGKVRFRQGDTLSLTCLYADYDGQEQRMAARHKVVLTHRGQVLETDSLNYDRLYNYAYFEEGGTLRDGKDRLVADWGKYNMDTRQAVFYYNVRMKSDDMRIDTDTLYYDTATKLAHVTGPGSKIDSKGTIVETTDAYYDTQAKRSRLYARSLVRDGQKTIVADSLLYVKDGDSYGYGNVVYTDLENKNQLLCDEMRYNEATGEGYATKRALMKDYSQGKDTLYAHGDSIRLYTYNINTDSVYRVAHCFPHVRVYRADVQAISDSLVFDSRDSCMTMYRDPIVWNGSRQLLGEVIKAYMGDSTIRLANVIGQALSIELMPDSTHYNQVASSRMNAYFQDGKLRQTEAIGTVRTIYYPTDDKDSTLIGLNYLETDTLRMYLSPERQLERIWASKHEGTLYPMSQIPTGRDRLDVFAWFADLRPRDKDDLYEWRGKKAGEGLVARKRPEAPLQKLEE